MKRYLLFFAAILSFSSVFAQVTGTGFSRDPNDKSKGNQSGTGAPGKTGSTQVITSKDEYYTVLPREDRSILVEVTGTGDMTFSVTNTASGTATNMSYSHSDKIVILLRTNSRDTSYQLVFYSADEEFKKVYSEEGAVRSIYFPMSMYADIRTKLEQSFAARKKVQLKLTFKKEEYNEAKLLFN